MAALEALGADDPARARPRSGRSRRTSRSTASRPAGDLAVRSAWRRRFRHGRARSHRPAPAGQRRAPQRALDAAGHARPRTRHGRRRARVNARRSTARRSEYPSTKNWNFAEALTALVELERRLAGGAHALRRHRQQGGARRRGLRRARQRLRPTRLKPASTWSPRPTTTARGFTHPWVRYFANDGHGVVHDARGHDTGPTTSTWPQLPRRNSAPARPGTAPTCATARPPWSQPPDNCFDEDPRSGLPRTLGIDLNGDPVVSSTSRSPPRNSAPSRARSRPRPATSPPERPRARAGQGLVGAGWKARPPEQFDSLFTQWKTSADSIQQALDGVGALLSAPASSTRPRHVGSR